MLLVEIAAKALLCVLLVDFLSGFLHWLEDAYGREHWLITGHLITKPNILHHHDGRYFTANSWFFSARLLLVLGASTLATAWFLGLLNWMTWFVVVVGVNANEIHKWAHRSPRENGGLITILQRARLLQTPKHHVQHHRGRKNTHYCVVTNLLNPISDGLGLWAFLEKLIHIVTGVKRRPDHSIRRSLG